MASNDPSGAEDAPRLLAGIKVLAERIAHPVRLMEVCGTHTMAIFRAALPSLLPESVKLLSGPGCPVCVTPMGYVDAAVDLASRPGVTVATFGDMLRVPGSHQSLERARADGAKVQTVYSPTDALALAEKNKDRQVVFLGAGFETTTPAVAVTILEAQRRGVRNFSVLSAHKLVPPALRALLADEEVALDGLILPGHVSVILGTRPYEFLAEEFGTAGVITGFQPADVLQGIFMLLEQVADGKPRIENQYLHVVKPEGNPAALARIDECMEPCDSEWRGLGDLPMSGLKIREAFADHDTERVLNIAVPRGCEPAGCHCGDVLRGVMQPEKCGLFATACTPLHPIGACMVSSEGTCAAHFKYREA